MMPLKPIANPPYDPPRDEVFVAFAEAVDSWSDVEKQAVMLLSIMLGPGKHNEVFAMMNTVVGFRNKTEMIRSVARRVLTASSFDRFERLIRRAERLSTKRNNLIHGVWQTHEVIINGIPSNTEIFRDYARGEPWGNTPTNEEEERKLIGKVRFYLEDIRRARNEFEALRRDLFQATEYVARDALSARRPAAKG